MNIKATYLKSFYLLIFIGYLISQYPFLTADADITIAAGSRGAWTDEGLYTAPVRNLINMGYHNFISEASISKTPYAIVTPLYSVFLFPFFKIFGISMEGARLITVLFCTILLFFLFLRKEMRYMGIAFILSTMMMHPVHQYTHLCLAEMYATLLIITGLIGSVFYTDGQTSKSIIWIFTFLTTAILFKIQFIYILPLPLLAYAWQFFSKEFSLSKKQFTFAISVFLFILISMLLLWFLPFQEAWKHTGNSSSGSISIKTITLDLILNNLGNFFFSKRYLLFTTLFLISFIAFIYESYKKTLPPNYLKLSGLILIWILLESHKITLSYLPIRYLISFYASMGLFMAVMFSYYFTYLQKASLKVVSLFLLMSCFILNNYFYRQSFKSRSFKVHQMNNYVKQIAKNTDIVIGPWAPSFTWNTKCITYPVWTVYTKNKDIFKEYRPGFIVSEHDQNDSNNAFKKDGKDLSYWSDSLTQTQIASWKINIYAVK